MPLPVETRRTTFPVVETLSSWVATWGPLPTPHAVAWAVRLAKRIEALHASGLTHGNISGASMLIGGASADARGVLVNARMVPQIRAYQSPERVANGTISQTDDAWAIGVMLYLALTGTLPFLASTEEELGQKIQSGSPEPLASFLGSDPGLQTTIEGVFARDITQ